MKRSMGLAAVVVALGLGAYLAGGLWARQPPAPARAPAQTRVAFVNLVRVIKSHPRYKTLKDERYTRATYSQDLAADRKRWQRVLDNPRATREEKAAAKRQLAEHDSMMADSLRPWKYALTGDYDRRFALLSQEVAEAVGRYAAANGFQIVLQYNEPPTVAERYSPSNIQRKMEGSAGTGCCIPVYVAPGLDITAPVIAQLNAGNRDW
jgi:Skp family chaperone for outer membrane proteins